jgi:predicted MFS family arabinose efflux permease
MTGAWGALAGTVAIQAMAAMAVITVPVMAPEMARMLDVPVALVGVYVAAIYACAMVSSLSAGAAVARLGAIRVSQRCLLSCAAGLAISAVPAWQAVAFGAVLIGFGYGQITPASSHLLARTTSRERMSLVFSLKQTGVPLGGALAGAVVPSLLLQGWQIALLAVSLTTLACAALVQPWREALDSDRDGTRPRVFGQLAQPLRLVVSHAALRRLAACSFVFSVVQLSLTTYLVTFLHTTLAYGLVAAGMALSVSQLAGVAGRVFWGYASDRWLGAAQTLAILAATMLLASLATALISPDVPVFLVLVVVALFGASAIGWNGVYLAQVAREAPPGQASVATGGTLAVTFFGVVVGPPLFGLMADTTGSYRAGFLALAVGLAICLVIMLKSMKDRRDAQTSEETA